jgi:hypothetical protein
MSRPQSGYSGFVGLLLVVGVRLRETGSSWELVSLGRPNAVPLEVGIVLV